MEKSQPSVWVWPFEVCDYTFQWHYLQLVSVFVDLQVDYMHRFNYTELRTM